MALNAPVTERTLSRYAARATSDQSVVMPNVASAASSALRSKSSISSSRKAPIAARADSPD